MMVTFLGKLNSGLYEVSFVLEKDTPRIDLYIKNCEYAMKRDTGNQPDVVIFWETKGLCLYNELTVDIIKENLSKVCES